MTSFETGPENVQTSAHATLVEQLAGVPDAIRRLYGERSSDDLSQPGQDGGKAAVEIVCHLQDWEEITGERVWRILREDHPELESYDDSLWSIEHDYFSRDALEALEAFAILRANLVETLAGADDAAWDRPATLNEHGTFTLGQLIEWRVQHDEKHLAQLAEALR